jgi:hypothetical protein
MKKKHKNLGRYSKMKIWAGIHKYKFGLVFKIKIRAGININNLGKYSQMEI